MYKIDLKDRKILYELDIDSRQSFNELSKKVRLGKDSVIYRVKRLQKQGIIKSFRTIIDVGKLGYISFRLFLKLQNTTPTKEKEIISFLCNNKNLGWMVSVEGNWDLNTWFLYKSVRELNDFWKRLLEEYNPYLERKWFSIFTKVTYFPICFIADKKINEYSFAFITEPEEQKIDKIDLEILKLLAPDSRKPIFEIANQLKLSPRTIAYRIRDLEKRKIILGYRLVLDYVKLGYHYHKIHFRVNRLKGEKIREFRQFIFQHPNIVYDDEVLGGEDLEIELVVRDQNELRAITNEIRSRFASIIRDYEILYYYREHKLVFLPIQ